jgi:hypothetical protein
MTRDEINQADRNTLNRLAATELMGFVAYRGAFFPATNEVHAATCRRKIEERGLQMEFAHALWGTLNKEPMQGGFYAELWRIANATPEQITRACLLAVCEE